MPPIKIKISWLSLLISRLYTEYLYKLFDILEYYIRFHLMYVALQESSMEIRT